MCRSSTCCADRRPPAATAGRPRGGGGQGGALAAALLACALGLAFAGRAAAEDGGAPPAAAAGAARAAPSPEPAPSPEALPGTETAPAAGAPARALAVARRVGEIGGAAVAAVDEAASAREADGAAGGFGWSGYDPGVDLASAIVKTIATLGGFLALAYLAVKLLGPRIGPLGGRPDDLIQVHALKRLDPKTTLYVVEVAGRFVLLSVSDQQVRALTEAELDAGALAARVGASGARGGGGRAFAALLASRAAGPPAAAGRAAGAPDGTRADADEAARSLELALGRPGGRAATDA